MDSYIAGLLAGIGAVLVIAAVAKFRARNKPMSITEKADYLSRRRARMLPALAVIYITQQASYISTLVASGRDRAISRSASCAW